MVARVGIGRRRADSRPIALAQKPRNAVRLQHGNGHLYFVPDRPALQFFLLGEETHTTGQVGPLY